MSSHSSSVGDFWGIIEMVIDDHTEYIPARRDVCDELARDLHVILATIRDNASLARPSGVAQNDVEDAADTVLRHLDEHSGRCLSSTGHSEFAHHINDVFRSMGTGDSDAIRGSAVMALDRLDTHFSDYDMSVLESDDDDMSAGSHGRSLDTDVVCVSGSYDEELQEEIRQAVSDNPGSSVEQISQSANRSGHVACLILSDVVSSSSYSG